MNKVTSRDGTTIAFDRLGDGPPVVLVSGGSTDRMANAPLAEVLAEHFSVFNYDRRGRGARGCGERARHHEAGNVGAAV
jgi:pimeloyl-ACP methyl ester carboxylesterase